VLISQKAGGWGIFPTNWDQKGVEVGKDYLGYLMNKFFMNGIETYTRRAGDPDPVDGLNILGEIIWYARIFLAENMGDNARSWECFEPFGDEKNPNDKWYEYNEETKVYDKLWSKRIKLIIQTAVRKLKRFNISILEIILEHVLRLMEQIETAARELIPQMTEDKGLWWKFKNATPALKQFSLIQYRIDAVISVLPASWLQLTSIVLETITWFSYILVEEENPEIDALMKQFGYDDNFYQFGLFEEIEIFRFISDRLYQAVQDYAEIRVGSMPKIVDPSTGVPEEWYFKSNLKLSDRRKTAEKNRSYLRRQGYDKGALDNPSLWLTGVANILKAYKPEGKEYLKTLAKYLIKNGFNKPKPGRVWPPKDYEYKIELEKIKSEVDRRS